MAQTPARDFIKTAEVDFRFYGGDVRNYANNANVLAGVKFLPTFQPAHGVTALTYTPDTVNQDWMLTGQTAATIEVLLSLDMLHLGAAASDAVGTMQLMAGDWQIGFMVTPGTDEETTVSLWASFSGNSFADTYYLWQDLSEDAVLSLHKGSMLHVVISVTYDAGTHTFDVTTAVNGVVTDATTTFVDYAMEDEPTNTLFGSTTQCPVYLLRMWDTYQDDADVLADLYREARRIVPAGTYPVPVGVVEVYTPV
jgi:hypothetical protein